MTFHSISLRIISKLSSRLLLLLELPNDIQIFHSAEHGVEINVQNVIVFFLFHVKHCISLGQVFFQINGPAVLCSNQLTLLIDCYCRYKTHKTVPHEPHSHNVFWVTVRTCISQTEQAPQAAVIASGNFRSLLQRPKLRNWRRSCTANCILHRHPALCSLAPSLRLPKTKGRAAALNFLIH
jgi:hypothetical protein